MRVRRFLLRLGLGLAMFLGAAAAGFANDINMAALGKGLALALAASPITWIVYALFVSLVEAVVLRLLLKMGYRQCLLYAVAANAASTLVGALWYIASEEMGWKTAWILERWRTATRPAFSSLTAT
jgi:hypothetical protein